MLKDKFGFNFWPSFTDLMLSLVLVVLIILFVVSKMIAAGSENLDRARESQKAIYAQIQEKIGNNYTIAIISDKDANQTNEALKETKADITIINKLDRQTITFSDKILFDSGSSRLKQAGYQALAAVGPVIKDNIENISEIQIQGHADIDYTDEFNLGLSANRAISVYMFLQHTVGIDPAEHLMSATSFGKYKPVGRDVISNFNLEQLKQANATEELKARNRRIEIVLFYKNEMK